MSREMKDSGIEWIGEIPKGWEIFFLSSLFEEHKEKNNKLEENNLLSLSYGNIVRKNIETKEGLLPASFDGYNIINIGDIVFRLTDLQNDKRSLRTGLCRERGIITSAYTTIRKRADILPEYFHYQFHSFDVCKVFYGLGDGVRQSMKYDDLKKLLVLKPSFPEQQKIANRLDTKCTEIDNLISLQEEMIAELKAYKQSVITEAVCKGLDNNVPMKDSGIAWIGEIPEKWNLTRLKLITKEIGDGLHGTPNYDDNGGYYFINGNNLGTDVINLHIDTRQVNENEYKKYKIKLDFNSILISLNGTIGNLSFYNGELVILSKSSGYINLEDTENKYFIKYVLMSDVCKRYFNNSFSGTTINNLSLNTLRNTTIVYPPLSEQQSIANYLDKKCANIDELISIKQQKADELKEYKKSMIYEYVTGKKEVI